MEEIRGIISESLDLIRKKHLYNQKIKLIFFVALAAEITVLLELGKSKLDSDDELLLEIVNTKKILIP